MRTINARAMIVKAAEKYHPCRTGIHICGADHEANEFFTEANYPLHAYDARVLFDVVKDEFSARGDEPTDFVVDLMINGDIVEDFRCTRQMLARMDGVFKGACDD